MGLESAVRAGLRRLEEDPEARARLFRALWIVSVLFTAFGLFVALLALRRQGVL